MPNWYSFAHSAIEDTVTNNDMAEHMRWNGDAWAWWWMVFIGLLVAGIVFTLIYALRPNGNADDALAQAKKRLASGEISLKEYQKIKKELGK